MWLNVFEMRFFFNIRTNIALSVLFCFILTFKHLPQKGGTFPLLFWYCICFFSLDRRSYILLFSHCCVRLFATPWIVPHQAPLSLGFPRQEYWSGLPCPPPGDLLDPGIEPLSPALQADSLPLSHQEST